MVQPLIKYTQAEFGIAGTGYLGKIFYSAFSDTTYIEQLTTNFDLTSLCVANVAATNHIPLDLISLKIKNNESYYTFLSM